jgi:hypothetical protein
MKIGGVEVHSKITIVSIARFASSKGIPMKKVDEFMDNITTDDLFGLFVAGSSKSIRKSITIDDLYKEWENNDQFIADLSNYISEQLDPKKNAVAK